VVKAGISDFSHCLYLGVIAVQPIRTSLNQKQAYELPIKEEGEGY